MNNSALKWIFLSKKATTLILIEVTKRFVYGWHTLQDPKSPAWYIDNKYLENHTKITVLFYEL